MVRSLLLWLSLLPTLTVFSQRVVGTVKSVDGTPLPYASVTVKGSSQGTAANDKARFSFFLSKGKHKLVCQYIGFEADEKQIKIDADTVFVEFVLKPQVLKMEEVVIRTDQEDPAYEIIRNAIKKRRYHSEEAPSFRCDFYSKYLLRSRSFPDKIFGQRIEKDEKKEMGLDTTGKGILYLSESFSKVHVKNPDKIKSEVLSSRVSGSNSFGFSFPTFISLYNNNVMLFSESLNRRGFISPIADGALNYYKFKFLGLYWENGKSINSIQVTPKRSREPLFTGIINISDDDWRVHSFDLYVTKKQELELLDTLRIKQLYVPVENDIWKVKNQLISISLGFFGVKAAGDFLSVYSQYELNPSFEKGFFDRVVIKYDTAVTSRGKEYWDTIRPLPLEPEEKLDYKIKDSLLIVRNDTADQDLDSLRRSQGKLKPFQLLSSGWDRSHYGKKIRYRWGVDPFLWNTNFNPAEGWNMTLSGYAEIPLKKQKAILSVYPVIRYGFANEHLNPSLEIEWRARGLSSKKLLRRWAISMAGGSRVLQFNPNNPISEFTNTAAILLYKTNFIKTYQALFAELAGRKSFESGVQLRGRILYEDRLALDNTVSYAFRKSDSFIAGPNYPVELMEKPFERHQAFLISGLVSFKPGQTYVQLPNSRVPMGSVWPTFMLSYVKGLNRIAGSDVNFDKWKFSVSDDFNMRIAGLVKYNFAMGGFFNRNAIFAQDYQHFNGNETWLASPYLNSFQMAGYYENSSADPLYGLAHIEYHLNGLLTNKIPYFNRLKWHLLGGSNAFYVDGKNNYADFFVGLENIFKIFRLDWVVAFQDGKKGSTGVRLGYGGLLGGAIDQDGPDKGKRRRSVTLAF